MFQAGSEKSEPERNPMKNALFGAKIHPAGVKSRDPLEGVQIDQNVSQGIVIGDGKAIAEFGALEPKMDRLTVDAFSGGAVLDAMEKAAIDYAIEQGVIIVASAGNRGTAGMGYPGAYEPVISVAASGWLGEWLAGNWWYAINDPDPNDTNYYYITDFSSRALEGQDLDVAAPGSWVVGPYQLQSGKTSYYFLGGTSMASPHVAGIAALMMQKNPTLDQFEVEGILETSALYLAPGCRTVNTPYGYAQEFCWGADATGAGIAKADEALNLMPDP
jgi:hypothetical protein